MSGYHDANKQTGLDMALARARTSVDIEALRSFLHDGSDKWLKRQNIITVLSSDPVFDKSQKEYMTRTEYYNLGFAMANRLLELQEYHKWTSDDIEIAMTKMDEQFPIFVHNVAFEPVFRSQGSPALMAKYAEIISTRGILGCYLQTELGHGTNVAMLETTATYIPDTQEFEIHSPTLTSSKWWIGALGKTATHGVVQAKLILPDGKDMGPHLFFVQLRSLEDHKVMSNIIIGDIGPKAMGGFATIDNGFARFNHVRIPKENMLSKFAQVTDDGKYIRPPHAKISYGGMLYIRASMVSTAGWLSARAATVAIRYATVRRQGEKGSNGLERQIISYPSVNYRLLPILSHAYVFIHLGRTLSLSFDVMSTKIAIGDTSLLAEMHATTAGLKVIVSTLSVQDVEVARRSMGGHGYSAFAGLGRSYANHLPSVTYEGDNFVLDQQVVRAALKTYKTAVSAKLSPATLSFTPSSNYLRHLFNPTSSPPDLNNALWQDPATSILLLEWRAAHLVRDYALTFSQAEILDASVYQRISRAVADAFVATEIGKTIHSLPSHLPQKDVEVVSRLYLLYLLTTVESALTDLFSFALFRSSPSSSSSSQDATRNLRLAIRHVCDELLPNAIGLTDAFGFSDWELDSALGVYDGKVYEALWERAQGEPLNRTEVPAAYEQSIKPMLLRGQAQARSKL